MEFIHILGYLGALAIGVVLGLMGSGGSLMAIPILTYMFHISPITTTAYSLFVVGTSASVGAVRNYRKGFVDLRYAIIFAVPCFISVYLVRKYVMGWLPVELFELGNLSLSRNTAIMLILALLMALAAISMLRNTHLQNSENTIEPKSHVLLVFSGMLIGVLTGIVGIGGGFLIIPVLVLLVRLPIKKAVATSLFIIAIKSLIGFLGDLDTIEINWSFLLRFTFIAVLGIMLGGYLSSFIDGKKLKKYFGWLLLVMAIGILLKELFFNAAIG